MEIICHLPTVLNYVLCLGTFQVTAYEGVWWEHKCDGEEPINCLSSGKRNQAKEERERRNQGHHILFLFSDMTWDEFPGSLDTRQARMISKCWWLQGKSHSRKHYLKFTNVFLFLYSNFTDTPITNTVYESTTFSISKLSLQMWIIIIYHANSAVLPLIFFWK